MTQLSLIDQPIKQSGKQLADRGIRKVAIRNADWLKIARHAARRIFEIYGSVTCDDVRQYCEGIHKHPDHPNTYGAIFRSGEWESIGWKESEIQSNHARPIRIWRLKDRS